MIARASQTVVMIVRMLASKLGEVMGCKHHTSMPLASKLLPLNQIYKGHCHIPFDGMCGSRAGFAFWKNFLKTGIMYGCTDVCISF